MIMAQKSRNDMEKILHNSEINHPKYRADIDGLRAIAVLLVVAFHGFPSLIKGGFIGVDIFFVISGFLISSIIIQSLINGQFSIINFYSRRIKRIFPALSLVLIFCLCFGWYCLTPYEFEQLGKNIAAGAAFVSNFSLWRESGYFDIEAQKKILLHLWSLGIEEQFYIIWPLLLWLCWRLRLNFFLLTLFALFASFILNVSSIDHDPVSVFYHPGTRFWELLIGSVLACITLQHKEELSKIPKIINNIASLMGVMLIVMGLIFLNQFSNFPGWLALFPTIGAALLIGAGENSVISRRILSSKVLVWIGLISFPLYLWHWPLFSFLRIINGGEQSIPVRIGLVGIAFIFSWLTFTLIETHVRRSKQTKPYLVFILIGLIALIGATGLFIQNRSGFPSRSPGDAEFRKNNWSYGWKNYGCNPEYLKIAGGCNSNSTNPPEILLIGDSHIQGLFLSLSNILPKSVMYIGVYLPLLDTTVYINNHAKKSDEANKAIQFAINSKSIDIIVIGFRGIINLTGTEFRDGHGLDERQRFIVSNSNPGETDSNKIMRSALSNTMEALSNSGKKIIFLVDTPELGFDPEACLAIRPINSYFLPKYPCAVPRDVYEARNREYRQLVYSILKKYPKVIPLDLEDRLCDAKWCWATKDGKLLYMDNNHLSILGSDFLANELINLVGR